MKPPHHTSYRAPLESSDGVFVEMVVEEQALVAGRCYGSGGSSVEL
jgi:hypothetical protein